MHPGPVKIFSNKNVLRLNYVAGLILGEILGLTWEIVTDKRKLGKNPVINYSDETIRNSFKINPCSLIFEEGIREHEVTVGEWKNLPVFFLTDGDSDLPFDIFAATFYMVTRYEEYLPYVPDQHGRFCASQSLAFRYGFLGIPVVDLWSREMAKVLVKKYQTLSFRRNEYKALLTIDVDEPFAFRGRNLIGNLKGFIHDFTAGTGNARLRYGCITNREKDPFEVFDYITANARMANGSARFFFPVGNHTVHENNPSWRNEEYQKLIRGISANFTTGLHPSYNASTDFQTVATEMTRLKAIIERDVVESRFHYLRLLLPQSYRNISKAGIVEDYSMGFHDEPGFRAGLARPFIFYDAVEDAFTNLRIYPFQVMDITLITYKNLQPPQAREVIKNMIFETRKAGGFFISIWHNTTLLDNTDCREWREVFEFTVRAQSDQV